MFYFLNLDRCAYGGRTDASKYFPEKTKPVRGPTFVASFKNNCSKIYSYDGREKKWKLKECNTTDLTMTCSCNAAGVFCCQSLGLLISFAAFCLLACEQSPKWKTRSIAILAAPQPEGLFSVSQAAFSVFLSLEIFFSKCPSCWYTAISCYDSVTTINLSGRKNNLQACFVIREGSILQFCAVLFLI